jgi:hypothetical protein
MKLEVYGQISINIPNMRFHKIDPVWAEIFLADGRMGRHDEGVVAFRNLVNALKNKKFVGTPVFESNT